MGWTHGQRDRPWQIGVLRALQLGDLLLAIPALRSLRAGFPDAEMTLIGLPWAAAFVQRFSRYLDRFVEFGGFAGIVEVVMDPERSGRFLETQRAYGYDLVVQMHGSGQASTPCALAMGGRLSVGYYVGEPPAGLTQGAPYPDDEPEIMRNLGLARLLGCPDRGCELEFPLLPQDHAEARVLLQGLSPRERPWIGMHVGSRRPVSRWPAERFARVADHFAREQGAQIVLTGGPGDEEALAAVGAQMRAPALCVGGETSLGGLAALIANMDLVISNDTGPAHIAEALAIPSVTIFGPADHRRWGPLDQTLHPIVRHPVECSPCLHWECPIDHRCLRWLEPARVIDAAGKLLAQGVVMKSYSPAMMSTGVDASTLDGGRPGPKGPD